MSLGDGHTSQPPEQQNLCQLLPRGPLGHGTPWQQQRVRASPLRALSGSAAPQRGASSNQTGLPPRRGSLARDLDNRSLAVFMAQKIDELRAPALRRATHRQEQRQP